MTSENKPTFLLVGNPQTSKNETLPSIDLLKVRRFRRVVEEVDRTLGFPPQGSLDPDRQIASLVMSVASNRVFVLGLEDKIQPGLLDPGKRKFNLVHTGHSIGEMAALVGAGVCGIPVMARILNEREKITQHPLESGFRQMVAIVGVDPDMLEAQLSGIKSNFAGQANLFMANYNTPRQAVIALEGLTGEAKTALTNLGRFISEIRDPQDTGKPLFPRFKLHPLLPNGFHTVIMNIEQVLYMRTIAPWLTEEYFQAPTERTVYSPTLPGWVTDLDSVFDVTNHILTKPVKFSQSIGELNRIPNLAAVITSDVLGTTPKMVKDNGIEVPIFNITNIESLNHAIGKSEEIIQRAA